jgi:hypothetical protein
MLNKMSENIIQNLRKQDSGSHSSGYEGFYLLRYNAM